MAKIALKIVFKLKRFSHEIRRLRVSLSLTPLRTPGAGFEGTPHLPTIHIFGLPPPPLKGPPFVPVHFIPSFVSQSEPNRERRGHHFMIIPTDNQHRFLPTAQIRSNRVFGTWIFRPSTRGTIWDKKVTSFQEAPLFEVPLQRPDGRKFI